MQMIYKMIYLFYCCVACGLLWMRRVTNYLARIVSQNRHEWKPPQLWRPNSCGIFSVSSRHSPSQRPNLKLLATEIFSPALGCPVHVSCVCSIFSCDTPFYSLAAQLHIRAAVRTTSFRELKLLAWSADRDAAETRGADVLARVHLPQSLRPVWFGLDERGMSGEGAEKEVKIRRGRKGEKSRQREMDCSQKVFEDGWTGRREAALSERETRAAEGEGRRQGHLRQTNVLQKKIIIQINNFACYSWEVWKCAAQSRAKGPLDVQTGKRLMKECIDRCVDSCGLSELSRSHSDRVFKRNNRRLMKFGCSEENGMPSVTGCSARERESVKRLMHKWKDKSGRASKSPADNVTLV